MMQRLWRLARQGLRPPPRVGEPADRRRWLRGARIGGGIALLLHTWMLTAGTWNLLRWERSAEFHEAQARAILHGSLAMDLRVLGIESFARGANAYMYFGPVPSFYRLPIVSVTRNLDGRLSAISMLVALCVLVPVVIGLAWRMRCRVLGGKSVSRGEVIGAAGLVFLVVGGSSLMYASSRTWVYHEAIHWGAAYTLASYSALLLWMHYGARRFLIWASVLATLAFLTRASVAGGTVVALSVVLVGQVAFRVADRMAPRLAGSATWLERAGRLVHPRSRPLTSLRLLIAAVALPVTSYALINWMKFRTLFSVPFERQGFTLLDDDRKAMLAQNGGSLFGWKFLPSNLLQYWRPDMIDISTRFPFIDFPHRRVTLIGNPVYDLVDRTAGIPATMPVLVILAVIGVVGVLRSQRATLVDLRPIVIGCAAGTLTVLNIGYIANRYQSDFLPLLVVAALAGAPILTGWLSTRGRTVVRGSAGPVVIVVMIVGGLFGTGANLALGYTYQRAYSPVTPAYQIAGYLHTQQMVDEWIDDGRLDNVRQGDRLPERGEYGDIFIVGDCRSMYWSDGMRTNSVKLSNWNGVERADGEGAFEATINFERPSETLAMPLFTTTPGPGQRIGDTVFVIVNPDSKSFAFGVISEATGNWLGFELSLDYDTPYSVRAVLDPRVGILELHVDKRLVLAVGFAAGSEVTYGEDRYGYTFLSQHFEGTIVPEPIEMGLCRELLDSVQGAD